MNRRREVESPGLIPRRPPWRLARAGGIALHRVGLGQAVTRGRLLLDRVLPVSVYRAGTLQLCARTVGEREYVREIQAGRDSYLLALVKIDVEGAEPEVLAGMSRWLAASPVGVRLIVESDPTALAAAGASVNELLARLKVSGFTPLLIDEHRRTLSPVHLETLRTRDANLYREKINPGSRQIQSPPAGRDAASGLPTAHASSLNR
jgi:hypothetical protein